MARQVLPLAGAVIGGYFGGPQGAQIGFAIGSVIGNAVDPQVIKTPGIQELPIQTANEGGYRQVVYGTCWVNQANIIDFGEVRRVTKRERQGKGGGPVVESERLYRTYAIGLGEPIEAIRVIRRDGKIVYDVRPGSAILADSAKFAQRFRFYSGSETQLPDPDLEALPANGVGNTPAYRGTAYIVFPNDDLTDTQGRIPTYEVEGVTASTVLNTGSWFSGPVSIGSDQGYLKATTPAGLVTSTPEPLPIQGSGSLLRISCANGKVFMHRDTAGCMSSDNGATWTACDSSLWLNSWARDVYWNGSKYWYEGICSDDGLTWAAIPNLPSGGRVVMARTSDGMVVVQDAGGVFHTTVTDGASWVTRLDASSGVRTDIPATDGADFVYTTNDNYPRFSTDNLTTGQATNYENNSVFSHFYSNGAWFGLKYHSGDGISLAYGIMRATAAGVWPNCQFTANFAFIQDGVNLDTNMMAFDGAGTCVAWERDGTDCNLYVSTNNGVSFAYAGTFTGNATNIAFSASSGAPVIEAGDVYLHEVVEDICDRCGLLTSEYDMSALTDVLGGVTLGGAYNGASAITTFMPAYFFDLSQPDKVLRAVKRGGAVKDTLTADDFVEAPDESILRGQDIEYPRLIMLRYLDAEQNYAAPAATVSRTSPDVRVTGETTIDLPINLDRSEAFRVADRILKVLWEDLNGEIEFSLPSGPFAWLAPSDCLGLVLRGGVYRIRVERVQEADGILKVKARRDRQSAYTSNLSGIPLPAPETPPPASPGATTFALMNLPALTDAQDVLGLHIAITGQPNTAWAGAQVEYRVSGDTDWTVIGSYTTRAVMGELVSPLPDASPFYTDTANTLSVQLINPADQLETVSDSQFLREFNACAIVNADGTAEVLQFKTATDQSGGLWDLQTLQRGRLNTEPELHSAGKRFVLLSGSIFVPLPSALIGQTLQFRVTSLGESPETAPTASIVWNPAYSQYEFAPEFLVLDRSGGTLSGSWTPRHRYGSDVAPIASVNFTGYQVTVTDGVVTDTRTVIDPQFSISDTPYASPVTVTVAALNRFTGAGPTVSETI